MAWWLANLSNLSLGATLISPRANALHSIVGLSEAHPACETLRVGDRPEAGWPPHVVIVGAGFGGLSAAKALGRAPVRVTLIDRRNYHLFQPLLYQVATAGLSPADIAAPIRGIVRHQRNTKVLLGVVQDVDTGRREVILEDKRLSYDYLIVATGARHAYTDETWERCAPGLKKIEDATNIRAQIPMAFEKAEATDDAQERESLLTFVIVGGGPTGVEMAGAIAELAQRALVRDFRNIDPCSARIILLQRGPRGCCRCFRNPCLAGHNPHWSPWASRSTPTSRSTTSTMTAPLSGANIFAHAR